MEITGKIIKDLPETGGTSKAGKAWRKKEYVLETQETYPKQVCFNLFNDRIDQYPMQLGDDVVVSVDVQSREFNGRWYTDVSAYKVEKTGAAAPAGAPVPPAPAYGAPVSPAGNFPPAPADLAPAPGATDDLPF